MGEWAGRRAFDEVLMQARAGDEEAFAELWRWLHPPLLRWLTVLGQVDVEDVESEVWISITRGLGSFEGGEGDFRGWAFTIARRRAIDWGRHRRRQPRAARLDGHELVDSGASTSSLVDEQSALDAALALLQGLTADQREVLALRVVVGMTVKETAAIVRKTESAVRVLCHRGLRALQLQLAADELAGGVTA